MLVFLAMFGKALVKELIHHGARNFFIAPGSRSSLLVQAIAEHPLAETVVHFDERGIGFLALGYAKATKTPAVIVVTSGSALAHLLPAVMEAYQSHTPLILLTADRPYELRDIGSNQTVEQTGFFNPYVTWSYDLPCYEEEMPDELIGSICSQLKLMSRKGPVHLNCQFREPFFNKDISTGSIASRTSLIPTTTHIEKESLVFLADELLNIEKGIIVTGKLGSNEIEPLFTLARRLQWPILPDILSEVRERCDDDYVIKHFDYVYEKPDAILHFGSEVVSKTALTKAPFYCHVWPYERRQDPNLGCTHRIIADPIETARALASSLRGRGPSTWFTNWQMRAQKAALKLNTYANKLHEVGLPFYLAKDVPKNAGIFFGNSMPIRDANNFYFPSNQSTPLFGNRGCSGIDGAIATTMGLSIGLERPMIGVLGDLTFLHDMTSLQIKTPYPPTFIVINNGGGGIFHFLPIANQKELLEPYFVAPPDVDISALATSFSYRYLKPETLAEVGEALTFEDPLIIELVTDRSSNVRLHKELQKITKEVCYA
ncbi:MAG: 2-succinyl-5-enolpyruvyl-6-hydroxy-3-cyclohexene-1-carboxylate synthase [Chlamydiia bacterium]|nr:2-succinyl-5-enolpyruvyl-6-hydroxy-3-cyclohexene-1-carboxylate synthase [Chlamydiia bacterium]MCH9615423.1 2-succinyl-5-enolpyruvyl-6-hydroxy-3-cyclohexene-1-carboxylate synthase [Chlamydiia bacterium]MCH9628255.1 2-succinyl-5-enolpyruvyl-6-hydroxy-3-cyclohexene-1-carboxylate synthase [Chlamydiia bacterium]